ncbi:MAG: F0F1 ATP synthase subunit B [Patescibacteria group bacterium]
MIAETTNIVGEATQAAASGGALGSLGINLKLFIAQLVNFGIVVLVLWKWVFTPLTQAMQKRTEEIEIGLEKSLQANKKLEEAVTEKEKALKSARAETHAMIDEAEKSADLVRQDKLNQTKKEIEKVTEEARTKLNTERQNTLQALQHDVAEMVSLAVSRVAVGLDEKTQRNLVDKAIKELEQA